MIFPGKIAFAYLHCTKYVRCLVLLLPTQVREQFILNSLFIGIFMQSHQSLITFVGFFILKLSVLI
jgi:hypothetical protein